MAAQQIQFAETIRAMKLAMRRNAANDDSDSEDQTFYAHTNRGNKSKKRARFAREGRLDDTGGLSYKKKAIHAGYDRYIVAKKPRLYDEDGDVVDPLDIPSDADDDFSVGGEPLEEHAFGLTQLHHLLRPLTRASDLETHPSLSIAYTSNALTQMAEEAAEMIRRENATLWKAKRLLERFRGDGAWMDLERFTAEHDRLLLQEGGPDTDGMSVVPSVLMDESVAATNGEDGFEENIVPTMTAEEPNGNGMEGIQTHDHVADANEETVEQHETAELQPNGDVTKKEENGEQDDSEQDSASRSGTNAPSHAMTTRARARSPEQLPSSPSPSPSDSASVPAVHPWFHPPVRAVADKDLGLPPNEAEDTRRTLLLYVQKQENIIRQLTTLYNGLQRADRLRRDVWQACRAEGHMIPDGRGGMQTEMSDGEDWYDPNDYNLHPSELTKDGKLEKGKDEIEDPAEEEGRRVGGRRRRVVGR